MFSKFLFLPNLFSRKWFCKNKEFSTKKVWWKFLVETCFRGNNLATIKNFRPKNNLISIFIGACFRRNDFTIQILTVKMFLKIFGRILFSRKRFCYHKKFSNKIFLMIIFGAHLFSRKWFCNHKKIPTKKFMIRFFYRNLFSRKWFCNNKNFNQKIIVQNFWKEPVFEEMTLLQ